LAFNPSIPSAWTHYRFTIRYREARLQVDVSAHEAVFTADAPITIIVYGKRYELGEQPLHPKGVSILRTGRCPKGGPASTEMTVTLALQA
jgi:cellobiose phosphorylase